MAPDATTIPDLGTLLTVWAHPDDETYLAGGLMAAAVDAGRRVVCACATAGEHGTDDPIAWPPERLARVRRWEAAAAMAVLGVDDHRWLGLPDGGLAALDPAPQVERLVRLIEEVQPDTIVTFAPDGATFHPDHQAVSRWVTEAWERTWRRARLLQAAITEDHQRRWGDVYESWGIYMADERPVPLPEAELAVHVVLDGADLDRKVAALGAMATQVGPAVASVGEATFRALNAEEMFVEVDATRPDAGVPAATVAG
ncbi:MAG TPA: PIG-L family deacetylase [Aquihabitans sp.]|jgi:LmbE family N-acetylglucosaminyl deacetylase|nr:PIG-L family deacetylase [Aquihabitans sp.]